MLHSGLSLRVLRGSCPDVLKARNCALMLLSFQNSSDPQKGKRSHNK